MYNILLLMVVVLHLVVGLYQLKQKEINFINFVSAQIIVSVIAYLLSIK